MNFQHKKKKKKSGTLEWYWIDVRSRMGESGVKLM